jgi:hypothetical protein
MVMMQAMMMVMEIVKKKKKMQAMMMVMEIVKKMIAMMVVKIAAIAAIVAAAIRLPLLQNH